MKKYLYFLICIFGINSTLFADPQQNQGQILNQPANQPNNLQQYQPQPKYQHATQPNHQNLNNPSQMPVNRTMQQSPQPINDQVPPVTAPQNR